MSNVALIVGGLATFVLLSLSLGCAIKTPHLSRAHNPASGSAAKNSASTQSRFLILSPRVKIYKEGFLTELKIEDGASDDVQAGLHGVLSRLFEDNGYILRLAPDQIAEWEEAKPNKAAIKALQDDYDSHYCPITYTLPDCSGTGKTSLQGDLSKIADSSEFDAVVFARARGFELTKAERFNPYSSGDTLSRFNLTFSINVVDMNTGVTLFYCSSNATGDYISAPDARLSRPVEKCLKPYFARGAKHH